MSLTAAETQLKSRLSALAKVKLQAARVMKQRASKAVKNNKRELEDDSIEAKKLKARRVLEAERDKEQSQKKAHAFIQESKDNLLQSRASGVGSSTGNINEAGSEGGSGHIGFSPSHSSQSHRPSQLDVIKNSSKLAMREAQEKRNKQHEQLLSRQQHQFDQHQQQRNSDLPLEYFLQTVYVGDLNPGVTNPQLAQEFAPFGKVVEIRITPNVRSSSALVTFESSASTKLAVDGMNDRQCCGGVVRVFPSRIPPNLRDHHDQYLAAMRQQQVNQTRSPMHQGQSPRHPPTTSPRDSVSNSPRHSVSNSPRHSVSNSPRHSISNSPRHSLTKSPHKGPHGAPPSKSNDAPKQPEHEVNKLPPQIACGQHAATRGSWVDQDGAAAAAAGVTVENASEHDASRGIKEYADI